uniref:Uncharacterized protein n=1 Tax=Populus trichocarpa TaxID=3694 RepID=A0A3N7HAC0_POPTR
MTLSKIRKTKKKRLQIKKSDGPIRPALQAMQIQLAPARNPSTARSGR